MFGSRTQVARADVVFESNLGVFRSEMTEAQRVYDRTTGAMSTDALRLAAAQERVNRAVDRYGPESLQAKQATVGLRQEMDRLALAASKADRELDDVGGRTSRASSTMGALRGSVALASASLLGGAGLLYALKQTVAAASEAENVLGQTSVALEAAGLSWERYGGRIEEAIGRQSRALAFDDEELLKGFQVFVRQTENVETSLERVALAAAVARGSYRDFEYGVQVVNKAAMGQAGAIRRLGIDVDKTAKSHELLAALQQKYGAAAEDYARRNAATQDRWNVTLENTKEIIGGALAPVLGAYLGRLTDYLDRVNESGELQRRLNNVMEDAEEIVDGLAGGVRTLAGAFDFVGKSMGGMDNAVQTFLILGALAKFRRFASGFGLITAASATARAKVAADAAAMSGSLGTLGLGAAATGLVGLFSAGGAGVEQQTASVVEESGRYYLRTPDGSFNREISEQQARRWSPGLFAGKHDPSSLRKGGRGGITPGPTTGSTATPSTTPTRGPRTSLPRTLVDWSLRAQLTPGDQDDLRAGRAQRAYWERQLALAKEGTAVYTQILQQLVAADGQVEAIEARLAAEQKRHDDAIAAQRARAAEQRRAYLEQQGRIADRELRAGPYATTSPGFSAAGISPAAAAAMRKSTEDKGGLTAADVAEKIYEAVTRMDETFRRYAGTNVTVNQTFPTPTPDRAMEARYARWGMEAAFAG